MIVSIIISLASFLIQEQIISASKKSEDLALLLAGYNQSTFKDYGYDLVRVHSVTNFRSNANQYGFVGETDMYWMEDLYISVIEPGDPPDAIVYRTGPFFVPTYEFGPNPGKGGGPYEIKVTHRTKSGETQTTIVVSRESAHIK